MLALIMAAALAGAGTTTADEALVRAAENHWSAAYVTGDAAYLQGLLAPSYVSVGEGGAAHPKAEIVASAVSYAKAHPDTTPTPMPSSSTVEVTGDLALVRHHAPDSTSVDVFQKRSGAWVAIYSQHTHIAAPAG